MAKKKAVRTTKATKKSVKKKATPIKRPSIGGPGPGRGPLTIVTYGPPGVGKSSWASYFPRPGFIIDPQEQGILELCTYGLAKEPVWTRIAKDWEDTDKHIADAVVDDSIDTLVLDSLTGFEKLCFAYHCREQFDNDWTSSGFYAYQQGPVNAAKTDWPTLMEALDAVKDAGKNVVVLGHSQVKPYNNPEGADYDRFKPYLHNETWQQIHRWAKAVLFYNYVVEIDRKLKGPRTKANMAIEQRNIYTSWSPAFDAKNQYGLPPVIDAGDSGKEAYKNFAASF